MEEASDAECAELLDVSSEKNGARTLFATDDFFGVAESLLKTPVSLPAISHPSSLYAVTSCRRVRQRDNSRRCPLKQRTFCILIHDVGISETWRQNRDGKLGGEASEDDYVRISSLHSENWPVLIPTQKLDAGYPDTRKKHFKVSANRTFTHLRLDIFPDGGIARLRVYGVMKQAIVKVDSSSDAFAADTMSSEFDLVSRINNGSCVDYSNAHYGHPNNIIKPGKATSIADGWETARRRDRSLSVQVTDADPQMPGCEWTVFKLGYAGDVKFTNVLIDTAHFKGNSPYSVKVEGGYASAPNSIPSRWKAVVPFRRIRPDCENEFPVEREWEYVSHVKVTITPDGGLSRLRVFGKLRRPRLDSIGISD